MAGVPPGGCSFEIQAGCRNREESGLIAGLGGLVLAFSCCTASWPASDRASLLCGNGLAGSGRYVLPTRPADACEAAFPRPLSPEKRDIDRHCRSIRERARARTDSPEGLSSGSGPVCSSICAPTASTTAAPEVAGPPLPINGDSVSTGATAPVKLLGSRLLLPRLLRGFVCGTCLLRTAPKFIRGRSGSLCLTQSGGLSAFWALGLAFASGPRADLLADRLSPDTDSLRESTFPRPTLEFNARIEGHTCIRVTFAILVPRFRTSLRQVLTRCY